MKLLATWFNPSGQINRQTYWLALALPTPTPMAVLIPLCVVGCFVNAYVRPLDGEASNDALAAAAVAAVCLLTALVLRLYV